MSDVKQFIHEYSTNEELKNIILKTSGINVFREVPIIVYPMRYIPWEKDIAKIKKSASYVSYQGIYRTVHSITSENINGLETVTPPFIDSSNNFSNINSSLPPSENDYVLTPLEEGWVYLRKERTDKTTWYEFRVKKNGHLQKCIWEDSDIGSDIRSNMGESVDHLKLSRNATYHLCFSDVQWSWDMYNKMEDDSNLRDQLMHFIEPSNINNGSQENIHNVQGTHIVQNPDFYGERSSHEQYSKGLDTNKRIIGIVDVLGIADVLQGQYFESINKMKDLLKSLRIGRNPTDISNERLNSEYIYKNNYRSPTKDILSQYKALQDITSIMNQLGNSSEETKKKIGKNIDQDRIDILLAKNEREELREIIINTKEKLINYLKSDLYQNYIEFYINNTPGRIVEGKNRIIAHHTSIIESPYEWDAFLSNDISSIKNHKENDIGFLYIVDILEKKGNYKVTEIINKPAEIDILKHPYESGFSVDFDAKLDYSVTAANIALTLNTVLGGFANLVRDYPKFLDAQIQILNTVELKGFGGDLFAAIDLTEAIELTPVTSRKFPDGVFRLVENTDEMMKSDFIATLKGTINIKQVSSLKMIEQAFKRPNLEKIESILEALTETKGFKGFVMGASYLNVCMAAKELLNTEGEADSKQLRDKVNFVNSLATSWAASYDFYRLVQYQKEVIDVVKNSSMKNTITKVGAVTCLVGAAISGYDSYTNFAEGDDDAAISYGTSAIFSIALGVILLGSNPIGWLVIVLGVGAAGTGIAGSIFEDTPLEHYAKNFILQNYNDFRPFRKKVIPPTTTNPWQSVIHHYTNRDDLINDKFKEWEDFTRAKSKLIEMLYGLRMEYKKSFIETKSNWIGKEYQAEELKVIVKTL